MLIFFENWLGSIHAQMIQSYLNLILSPKIDSDIYKQKKLRHPVYLGYLGYHNTLHNFINTYSEN